MPPNYKTFVTNVTCDRTLEVPEWRAALDTKARFVTKGYSLSHGIEYKETIALAVKFNTIKVLLSMTANRNWPPHQMDEKNVFLNGNLKEVYMEIPPRSE